MRYICFVHLAYACIATQHHAKLRLNLSAIVYDRFQRRLLQDEDGTLTELPDLHPTIISKAPTAEDESTEIIRLYCNTHEDEHGTPYHYEWISGRASSANERQSDSEHEAGATSDAGTGASPPVPLHAPSQLRPRRPPRGALC